MNSFFKNIFRLPTWVVFFVLVFPFFIMHITQLSSIMAAFVLALWLLASVISLQKEMPKDVKINTKIFIIELVYAFIYMAALELFFSGRVTSYLIPFHIIAVLSIFSCLFTAARFLVICEEKRKQRFDKYIGTFLLFWFYPIGIWFINPRMKKILRIKN